MSGRMAAATRERCSRLVDPDPALVALADTLAALLDDPETCTAAAAKEYRVTMLALAAASPKVDPFDAALDGVADDDG